MCPVFAAIEVPLAIQEILIVKHFSLLDTLNAGERYSCSRQLIRLRFCFVKDSHLWGDVDAISVGEYMSFNAITLINKAIYTVDVLNHPYPVHPANPCM